MLLTKMIYYDCFIEAGIEAGSCVKLILKKRIGGWERKWHYAESSYCR